MPKPVRCGLHLWSYLLGIALICKSLDGSHTTEYINQVEPVSEAR